MSRFLYWAVFWASVFLSSQAGAAEVIHNYHTQIKVLPSGDIQVRETINVTAEGDQIKRGIYRDLPLLRGTFGGGLLPTSYEILSIKRDGQYEQYHTETTEGLNLRIYIGEYDYFLPTGRRYNYEIEYSVKQQVFFFKDFDQIYWNAIGTGWVFPIEQASADIRLPRGTPAQNYVAYTGKALSTAGDYKAEQQGEILHFEVTRPLDAYEGLTVSLNIPKGLIEPDPSMTGSEFFFKQNLGLQYLLGGLLILLAYYLYLWSRVGRDPKGKAIIPQYSPPEGISPAMAAHIITMGSAGTKQTLTAAIVSLAAKGYFTVEQISKQQYNIYRTMPRANGGSDISEDEQVIYDAINPSIGLSPSNEALVTPSSAHSVVLDKLCKKRYYNNNTLSWFFGFLIAAGIIIGTDIKTSYTSELTGGFLSGFSLIIWIISEIAHGSVNAIFKSLRKANSRGDLKPIHILTSFVVSLVAPLLLFLLFPFISLPVLLTVLLLTHLVIVMRTLLKAPTVEGRAVMDHVAGLRYYMSAVEEKVLQKFDPPEMSRDLYEKYLPYAVGLGVESKWGEKLAVATALAATAAASSSNLASGYYGPTWYSHSNTFSPSGGFSIGSFTNSISSTISSASSSSGSSGGGSSGGGGGGGGGGGW